MTEPKSRRFGNYEILSRLGRGGMAEVFRARVIEGPRAGWTVALKRLLPALASDPAYVDLFTSEADLSKTLTHPNIVRVFDVGVHNDIYFMVMEWVDGRDLGQILKRCKARGILLPIDFCVYLAVTLLEALGYAHAVRSRSGEALGLVHCDVSPSNVFVSRAGEVKLGDFGVARGRTLSRPQDLESRVEGKPYYLSPEVLQGTVTPQADLWAAAVVLYELLTLERPFQGDTPEAVFASLRARRFVPLRLMRADAPPALEKVLDRAFGGGVSDRYGSAAALGEALTPLHDPRVGTPLGIAGLVRGLFGVADTRPGD